MKLTKEQANEWIENNLSTEILPNEIQHGVYNCPVYTICSGCKHYYYKKNREDIKRCPECGNVDN